MKVCPHIMLQGGIAEQAVALWTRAFPTMTAQAPQGPMDVWKITLGALDFTLFDSPMPHDFAPTPSWSFMIDLDTGAEVDKAAAILSEGGQVLMPAETHEFANRFAWVEDRFQISWQLRFGAA